MIKPEEWIFALVGDKGVGKKQFCKSLQGHIHRYGSRPPNLEAHEDPTFKRKFRRKLVVDKKLALVELDASNVWSLDISLESEAQVEQMTYLLERTRCFLLTYNTISKGSFAMIESYYHFVREVYAKQPKNASQSHTLPHPEPRFFLIGLKPDVQTKGEVSPASGEELAIRLYDCLGFVECCYKEDLSQIVFGLVRILREDAVSSGYTIPRSSDHQFTLEAIVASFIPWVRKMFRRRH